MEASPNIRRSAVSLQEPWIRQPNPVYVGRDYAIHNGVPPTCPLDVVGTRRGAILGYRTTDNYAIPLTSQQEFLRGERVRLNAVPIRTSGDDAVQQHPDAPVYEAVHVLATAS